MNNDTGPCDKCQGEGKRFDPRCGDVDCDECNALGWFVNGTPVKITINFEYPPIPQRHLDWSAVQDGYEPGAPIGRGATKQEAIEDLLYQLEEQTA